MAELMLEADLAIGAGGSTNWERCCLGLPSLIKTIADNQIETVSDLAEMEMIEHLGNDDQFYVKLPKRITKFYEESILGQQLSENSMKLVDGNGCFRIIKVMEETNEVC